jgi:DNA repair protein RadC
MSKTHNSYTATEVELIYKGGNPLAKSIKVSSSTDCFKVLRSMWDENRIHLLEEFKMIVLDNDGSLLGVSHISTGTLNSCLADPKIIFTTALMARSASIVVAHNHPSSSLNPSEADMKLTKKLVDIGKLLDIKVHDHLILTKDRYYSFVDSGVMPV